jgi:thymidylate synthase ThyX/very-short-patch-repair endonuclease
LVVKAALQGKTLPQPLEAPSFTWKIQGCSRSAFDQLARARFTAIGSVGCIYSSIGAHPTIVFTDKGWKDIKKVKVGDLVLTHKKRFRKVLKVFTGYSTPYVRIETKQLGRPISVTPEHPFLINNGDGEKWVRADQLKPGDKLVCLSVGRCAICNTPIPFRYHERKTCSTKCQRIYSNIIPSSIERNAWYKRLRDPKRMSKVEKLVKGLLEILEIKYEYGYPVPHPGGIYFIDFAIPEAKIGIEVHGNKLMLQRMFKKGLLTEDPEINSKKRREWLERNGWKIIDIEDNELFVDLKGVFDKLKKNLNQLIKIQNDAHIFEFALLEVKRVKIGDYKPRYVHNVGRLLLGQRYYNFEVEEDNSFICNGFVVHNSRDNSWLDAALVLPSSIKKDPQILEKIKAWWKATKDLYEEMVVKGRHNWQTARFILPQGVEWRFTWSMSYRSFKEVCAIRLTACEQEDTVATVWRMWKNLWDKFPLLAVWCRPRCDFSKRCVYAEAYSLSELFSCLFNTNCEDGKVGRWPSPGRDYEYATFNESSTTYQQLENELGFHIPRPSDWEKLEREAEERDRRYFE